VEYLGWVVFAVVIGCWLYQNRKKVAGSGISAYFVAYASSFILGFMEKPAFWGVAVGGAIATFAFYNRHGSWGYVGNVSWRVFIFLLKCVIASIFYGVGRLFSGLVA
jgi:hypothetical protein